MSAITLLDGSLKLSIYYEELEPGFEDNFCFCFQEDCPEDEKVFKADEINIYLTPEEVALVILELNRTMEAYRRRSQSAEST